MTFDILLALIATGLGSGLGIAVLYQRPQALVARAFALGMLVLALREACVALGAWGTPPLAGLRWPQLGWVMHILLPGSWLLFSLTFARSNDCDFLRKWKWVIVAAIALPLVVLGVFRQAIFLLPAAMAYATEPSLSLGRAGSALCIFGIVMAVVILVNLEASLRAARGTKRAQIKFMILGVGTLFAVYIYTTNQAMLFATVSPIMQPLNSFAAVLATLLISVSLARHRLGSVHVSLSPTTLANSFSVLFVGMYLLVVGVMARIISAYGSGQLLPLGAFFVFVALVGLAVVLLSDRVRQRFKHFLGRHVYQARHDYRQGWMTFAERTASVVDVEELCAVVTKMVSETLMVADVTIWLWQDEATKKVRLGGSTVFSEEQASPPGLPEPGMVELFAYLRTCRWPVDLAEAPDAPGRALWQSFGDGLQRARIHYAVPLRAGQAFLGVMTLHGRWINERLTLEDTNLLKVIADQTATSLLNLRLLQRLARAQQMEAFQTLSMFFVHDLKNLASNLGMALQNLPVHYDNPAFRDNLLGLIADSVSKVHGMRDRLSLLSQQLELHRVETDLNELVRTTLAGLRSSLKVSLRVDLHPLPRLPVDPEQLEKVLVNLVVNAQEAMGSEGEICVTTERLNDWAVLSVQDTGCGMSRQFIDQSLFQPFRTTKRQGLGIGLFQSKTIVEAHHGRIEVESEEGKGSTFQVLLPY